MSLPVTVRDVISDRIDLVEALQNRLPYPATQTYPPRMPLPPYQPIPTQGMYPCMNVSGYPSMSANGVPSGIGPTTQYAAIGPGYYDPYYQSRGQF